MPLKQLHQKLVLYVLSAAIFLAAIAATLSFVMEFNHSKEQSEVMLTQLMDAVENSSATAAYNRDIGVANDVINGLLRNNIVYKVSIISDTVIIAEKEKQVEVQSPKQVIRPLYSPFANQQAIGQLIISLDTQLSAMEAQNAGYISAAIPLLLIVLTTIILLILVYSNISQPLSKVSNTVHAIKSGDDSLIPILEKHKDDELGRLIDDINDLLINQEIKLTQEQRLRKSIQHMEQQLRQIFDSSSAGLFFLDNNGQLMSYNPTLLKVLHCDMDMAPTYSGEDFATLFISEVDEFEHMLSNVIQTGQLHSQDFLLKQEHTPPIWVHCLLSKVISTQGEDRIEGVIFDVSRRVKNEQAIKHKAEHDSLTGLLQRQAIKERFERYVLAENKPDVSVFLLDLDGFKQANDTYGHDVGDKVLTKTASRLKACVRSDDLVCRLGGDEFLVIILNNHSSDIALTIAKKMINNIQFPMPINKTLSVNVGVSIGISITPQHGQSFEDLVKAADEAMYEVKRQGKNGYGIKTEDNQIQVKLF